MVCVAYFEKQNNSFECRKIAAFFKGNKKKWWSGKRNEECEKEKPKSMKEKNQKGKLEKEQRWFRSVYIKTAKGSVITGFTSAYFQQGFKSCSGPQSSFFPVFLSFILAIQNLTLFFRQVRASLLVAVLFLHLLIKIFETKSC